jgi:hypothetical protein
MPTAQTEKRQRISMGMRGYLPVLSDEPVVAMTVHIATEVEP